MFCEHCGNHIDENDRFCQKCGAYVFNEELYSINQRRKKRKIIITTLVIICLVFLSIPLMRHSEYLHDPDYGKDNSNGGDSQLQTETVTEKYTSEGIYTFSSEDDKIISKSYYDGQTPPTLSVATYKLIDYEIGNNDYAFIEIKNNSSYDLAVSLNVEFYDSKDNLIDSGDDEIYALGWSETALLEVHCDKHYSYFKCSLVTRESQVLCMNKNFTYSIKHGDKKEIITLTNNSSDEQTVFADVGADVLFFKNGKVVDSELVYFHNVTPGRSVTSTVECFYGHKDYDEYKFYLSGNNYTHK